MNIEGLSRELSGPESRGRDPNRSVGPVTPQISAGGTLLRHIHIFRVFFSGRDSHSLSISLGVPWYISQRCRRVPIAEFRSIPDPVERSGSQDLSTFLTRFQLFVYLRVYTV